MEKITENKQNWYYNVIEFSQVASSQFPNPQPAPARSQCEFCLRWVKRTQPEGKKEKNERIKKVSLRSSPSTWKFFNWISHFRMLKSSHAYLDRRTTHVGADDKISSNINVFLCENKISSQLQTFPLFIIHFWAFLDSKF